MKNYIIVVLLMLFMIPAAFAGMYTDTSRNYFTQKCYSGGIGDCFSEGGYLLNNYMDGYYERLYNIQYPSNTDSRVEYNSSDWSSCNLVAGGSKYRGLPFNYDDPYTNYTFSSFIRLRDLGNSSYIEQINSNCQIFDQWGIENTSIVSQLGMINKGNEYGMLPFFAYAYNKTTDGNVYMRVFTLENDTNILKYLGDFFIADWEEFGNYDDNMGVAGGVYTSDENDPSTSGKLVFGLFSKTYNSLFILYGHVNYPYFSHSEMVDVPDFADNSTNHQLFFDDWDADGNNEFILLGASYKSSPVRTHFNLNRVVPSLYAPHYYVYNEVNFTPSYIVAPNGAYPQGYTDGNIVVCQIGNIESPLEACVSGYNSGYGTRNYAAVINNAFTAEIFTESDGTSDVNHNLPMFSMYKDTTSSNAQEIDICIGYGLGACGSEGSKIECRDENGVLRETIIPNDCGSDFGKVKIIVGELDGNYSSPELIYSSGEINSIRWNTTAVDLGDWEGTFDWTYEGNMWLQDISGDNRNELIYMDDTFLRIYSMNHTPATFLSYEELLPEATTSTTGSSTTTTTLTTEQQTENFKTNVKLIIAMFLILGIMGFMAWITRSTIVTIFGGIIGLVLSVAFELISSGVLVILLISLVILLVLGLFIMKRGD